MSQKPTPEEVLDRYDSSFLTAKREVPLRDLVEALRAALAQRDEAQLDADSAYSQWSSQVDVTTARLKERDECRAQLAEAQSKLASVVKALTYIAGRSANGYEQDAREALTALDSAKDDS